jgi:outer membrane receptor protein involved in Fe transport
MNPTKMPAKVCAKVERLNIVALLSLLTASVAFGQTPAPDQTAKKEKEAKDSDETIVLSPFVVDASKDQGYRATSTLAGTRIKTPLKDIAAPITVVTKDFLEDVGARDINDVLPYLANTESARNYTIYSYSAAIGNYIDDTAANPQLANRVRGLAAASIARDYFDTIGGRVGFDSYNVDEVTVSRGPNSALFGLGSAAGIINYSLSKAKLGSDSNKVTFAYGSFGDQRATVDFNRVLIKDKLALRLQGLWSDRGYEQQPAWYRDKRIFLAGIYKPFSKTTIRANYEHARVNSNNPNSTTPIDNVSAWIAAGRPTWDPSTQLLANAPAYFTADAPSMPLLVLSTMSKGVPEYAFQGREGNPASNLTGPRGWVKFDPKESPGIDPQQLGTDRYYDLHKFNMRPSPSNLDYVVRNISLEQEILPDLALNLEYFQEKFHSFDLNFARQLEFNIDPNSKLPDGRTNPHFLETYTLQWTQENLVTNDLFNKALRATLAYKLDLAKYSKWFGTHQFSAFVERREDSSVSQRYGDERANIPAYAGSNNLTNRINYTGGSVTPDASSSTGYKINQINQGVTIPVVGAKSISSTYWDVTANAGAGGWASERLDMGHIGYGAATNYHKVESQAAVWQPYLLDSRIVGMLGWRKDKDLSRSTKSSPDIGDPFSARTISWGVVAHPLKWLSLHYSKAENFKPTGARKTTIGDPIGPQGGNGKDYGFSLDLLDGKFNIKINKFEVLSLNAPVETQSIAMWELVQMDGTAAEISTGKLVEANDPRIDPLNSNHSQLNVGFGGGYGEVMSAVRNYNTYQIANNTGAPLLQYQAASPLHGAAYWGQIASTSDQLSKGYELEATYNPTPNWRIMFNVSQQKANASNVEGPVKAFLALRKPIWEKLGPLWDTTNPAYFPTAWARGENLHTRYNNLLSAGVAKLNAAEGRPSPVLREWHANIVTNYTFTEGRLKNVGVGGAARYESAGILGNPIGYDANGVPNSIDLDHPYRSSPGYNVDLWASYRRRIWNDKVNWTLQLNVRDVQSNGGVMPIHANPASADGSIKGGIHNAYRIVQPRTFYLTSAFEF